MSEKNSDQFFLLLNPPPPYTKMTSVQHYAPQTTFEKETLFHLVGVTTLRNEGIGTMDQRITYAEQYLLERYGDDPEHEKVPSFFKEKYNSAQHKDALDLDVWITVGLYYASQHKHKHKKDIKNGVHKARKKLKKFCKRG